MIIVGSINDDVITIPLKYIFCEWKVTFESNSFPEEEKKR